MPQVPRELRRLLLAALALLALAAPMATAAQQRAASPGQLNWTSPALTIHQAPFAHGSPLVSLSCAPAGDLCVGVDRFGNAVHASSPSTAVTDWTTTKIDRDPDSLTADVSCPTSGFCAFVDGRARIYTSTDPGAASSTWKATQLEDGDELQSVSCPTATFCVATTGQGAVYTSANPTGGTASWTRASIDPDLILIDVACPTTSFCALLSSSQQVITSTNPTGGAAAWSSRTIDADRQLVHLACASSTLCVAADNGATAYTSTAPADRASSWNATTVVPASSGGGLFALACPTTSLCVAGGSGGKTFVTTDPAAATPTWSTVAARSQTLDNATALACSTATSCALATGDGRLSVSTAPTIAGSWTTSPSSINGVNALTHVECPSATLCVASDDAGHLLTASAGAWTTGFIGTPSTPASDEITALSCPTTSRCFGVTGAGKAVTTADPAGGASTWSATSTLRGVTDLSCPTASLCVAVGQASGGASGSAVFTSTNPTASPASWTETPISGANLQSISCASATSCTAIGAYGQIVTSSNPTGGSAAWSVSSPVESYFGLGGGALSCPTSSACVAVDNSGNVWSSSAPSGGADAWHVDHVFAGGGPHRGVSCSNDTSCVATSGANQIASSTQPTGDGAGWTAIDIDGARDLSDVSCPSTDFCAAVTGQGETLVGSRGVTPAPDTTAPRISVTRPSDGQHFAVGAQVTPAYTCTDEPGGSGVASCTAASTLDTSTPGPKILTVSARDNAGNERSIGISYFVDYPQTANPGNTTTPPTTTAPTGPPTTSPPTTTTPKPGAPPSASPAPTSPLERAARLLGLKAGNTVRIGTLPGRAGDVFASKKSTARRVKKISGRTVLPIALALARAAKVGYHVEARPKTGRSATATIPAAWVKAGVTRVTLRLPSRLVAALRRGGSLRITPTVGGKKGKPIAIRVG